MKKLCLLLVLLLCLPQVTWAETTYDMTYPFENGIARFVQGGKWGLVDDALESVLSPTWDYIGEEVNGFRIIARGGLYGFANEKGKQVIAPAYARVENFSEGLAAVMNAEGKWGFIDEKGKTLIEPFYMMANSFSDGRALVNTEEGLFGYIDTDGEMAIPATYSEAYPFSEGLACVKVDEAYGYIDTGGNLVIPAIYELAFDFSEGFSVVKSGGYGLIERNGNVKLKTTYSHLSPAVYMGLLKATKNGKTGIINTLGETLLPFAYTDIGNFFEGLCPVRNESGWHYINEDFDIEFSIDCDFAGEFSNDFAPFMQDELWGYVDSAGNIAVPPVFSAASRVSSGYAAACLPDGKYEFIDPATYVPPAPPIEELPAETPDDTPGEETPENTLMLHIGSKIMKTPEGDVTLDTAPAIYDDYTLLPIRAVTEAIGGTVDWDPTERKVTLKRDSHVVILRIDDASAFVDGRITILAARPRIENDRTLIPLRFAAESLECTVDWDPDTAKITITY